MEGPQHPSLFVTNNLSTLHHQRDNDADDRGLSRSSLRLAILASPLGPPFLHLAAPSCKVPLSGAQASASHRRLPRTSVSASAALQSPAVSLLAAFPTSFSEVLGTACSGKLNVSGTLLCGLSGWKTILDLQAPQRPRGAEDSELKDVFPKLICQGVVLPGWWSAF